MIKGYQATAHAHVSCSASVQGGEPVIGGTRFPVRSVVYHILHEGKTPEELHHIFPRLSMAGIYDALAYYYDHKTKIDSYIRAQKEHLWKRKLKS